MKTYRIVFLGAEASGKTTLMNCLLGKAVNENDCYFPTRSTVVETKKIESTDYTHIDIPESILNSAIKVYQDPSKKNAMFVLCFDLSQEDSLTTLEKYFKMVGQDKPILLVGTKSDLESKVSEDAIKTFVETKIAAGFNIHEKYITTSTKNDETVDTTLSQEIQNVCADKLIADQPYINSFEKSDKETYKSEPQATEKPKASTYFLLSLFSGTAGVGLMVTAIALTLLVASNPFFLGLGLLGGIGLFAAGFFAAKSTEPSAPTTRESLQIN